ncbi:hypothetical protein F5Y05DRAFT_239187 [Hypoxylon sp. FL0543]|nr:hypothetical protein F5Y05DRAFT_239187 [Hypoxylon sp. FL0543]
MPLQAAESRKSFSTRPIALRYHLYSVYLTCASNIWDVILPGVLFGALNAFIAPRFSMGPSLTIREVLRSTPSMFIWSSSNLFLFSLHNQRQPETIAEDALNKPWRPIPAGRFTAEQAKYALYFTHPFCLVIASTMGGLVPYSILTIFHVWYNEFGGASNGILKNIINAVGIACFLAGPLEVVTGHSVLAGKREAAMWLILLMGAFATTSHTQDFRDVDGDRAAGRQTLPLVIGNLPARVLTVLVSEGSVSP